MRKRVPPYWVIAVVGSLIAMVLLVGPQKANAQDLAKAYSEGGIVALIWVLLRRWDGIT